MAQSLKVNKFFGDVHVLSSLTYPKTQVTQGSYFTSGITINSPTGTFITTTANTATLGSTSIAVSYANLTPTSVILTSINGYSGNGFPSVRSTSVTKGSFNLVVSNYHTTAPLSAPITVGYSILL